MKYYILPLFLVITIVLIFFSGNFTNTTSIIKTNQNIKSEVFRDYNNEYLFVFFGYVGCSDICTPRLQELSFIYNELKANYKIDIDTLFINISILRDSTLPQLFASSFNKDFDGFYLNNDSIKLLKKEFSIYSSPSLRLKGDYDHSTFLFFHPLAYRLLAQAINPLVFQITHSSQQNEQSLYCAHVLLRAHFGLLPEWQQPMQSQ